ncbi:MAG: hypothetical protein Q9160_008168 [Pyrenula sp. 1 TL-2023]
MHTKRIAPAISAGAHMWNNTPERAALQDQVIALLRRYGVKELDTARRYQAGESESYIGNTGLSSQFRITTKAPAGIMDPTGATKDGILKAGSESLSALKTKKVSIYLLHAPSKKTPVAETMEGVQQLYREGAFDSFGISNFTAAEVEELFNYCKSKDYVLPTIYQANYNLLARKNEKILFETLRNLRISIQVYSPVAGGFLTKTSDQVLNATSGRWDPNTLSGKMYRSLYARPSLLKYLDDFNQLSEETGISRVGLAYRWTMHNSFVDGSKGDTIIIGAADPEQFKNVMEEVESGPLSPELVHQLDEMWKSAEAEAPVDNMEFAM